MYTLRQGTNLSGLWTHLGLLWRPFDRPSMKNLVRMSYSTFDKDYTNIAGDWMKCMHTADMEAEKLIDTGCYQEACDIKPML